MLLGRREGGLAAMWVADQDAATDDPANPLVSSHLRHQRSFHPSDAGAQGDREHPGSSLSPSEVGTVRLRDEPAPRPGMARHPSDMNNRAL